MAADGLRIWVFLILTLLGTCFASHSSAREIETPNKFGINFMKTLNDFRKTDETHFKTNLNKQLELRQANANKEIFQTNATDTENSGVKSIEHYKKVQLPESNEPQHSNKAPKEAETSKTQNLSHPVAPPNTTESTRVNEQAFTTDSAKASAALTIYGQTKANEPAYTTGPANTTDSPRTSESPQTNVPAKTTGRPNATESLNQTVTSTLLPKKNPNKLNDLKKVNEVLELNNNLMKAVINLADMVKGLKISVEDMKKPRIIKMLKKLKNLAKEKVVKVVKKLRSLGRRIRKTTKVPPTTSESTKTTGWPNATESLNQTVTSALPPTKNPNKLNDLKKVNEVLELNNNLMKAVINLTDTVKGLKNSVEDLKKPRIIRVLKKLKNLAKEKVVKVVKKLRSLGRRIRKRLRSWFRRLRRRRRRRRRLKLE